MEKKLSTMEHWNSVLRGRRFPRVNNLENYNYLVTYKTICKYLKGQKNLIEIGCGASGWLPLFYLKDNLSVGGIDYSSDGVRDCKKNLDVLGINSSNIFLIDFLEDDLTVVGKYDVVFSYGFIEHFSEPDFVIKRMIQLLASPNSVLINVIPNMKGIPGWLTKITNLDLYKMHVSEGAKFWIEKHEQSGGEILFAGYVGKFSLAVINWQSANLGIFKIPIIKIIQTLEIGMGKLFSCFSIGGSETFSPYFIVVSKKA